ncbi:methionyl-tRNA formyltransferase [Actinoallomurus purpureus]|uniref:methionyl-tRNA formyltransferase n=1 Tax=Actinoallomurus purpureus TaxID=478114 RepID=UPI0020922B54|nr:formyltransferase family protein [Actinoallomurus purpureus]
MSRSMRPNTPPEPDLLEGLTATVARLPGEVGLLLPGGPADLRPMLDGYAPELLVVFGFNWKIPRDILDSLRYGALNIHPSLLPKYRGPSPIPWAIRNGDRDLGMTIHRMTEKIDAGPILAQGTVGRIPEMPTHSHLWDLMKGDLGRLLTQAVSDVLAGAEGSLQPEEEATYAGFPPAEWNKITWKQRREDAHNQVRVFRFLNNGSGPVVDLDGRQVRILRTSPREHGDLTVECSDGLLWITEYEFV